MRNIILEIFNRIPHTEQLSDTVPNLLKMAMNLLNIENEENAIICLRIIIDLHKIFRYACQGNLLYRLTLSKKLID